MLSLRQNATYLIEFCDEEPVVRPVCHQIDVSHSSTTPALEDMSQLVADKNDPQQATAESSQLTSITASNRLVWRNRANMFCYDNLSPNKCKQSFELNHGILNCPSTSQSVLYSVDIKYILRISDLLTVE